MGGHDREPHLHVDTEKKEERELREDGGLIITPQLMRRKDRKL